MGIRRRYENQGLDVGRLRPFGRLAVRRRLRPGAPTNSVVAIGTVLVEGTALSKYRPEKVSGGSFTDVAPELLPCVVDTLTEDFIRERNPKPLA